MLPNISRRFVQGATEHCLFPLSRRRGGKGFSLVELLVVVAVIAVLSTFTIGIIGTMQSWQITTAASNLQAAAHQARQKAVSSGKAVELRLYSEGNPEDGDYDRFRIYLLETPDNEVPITRMHYLGDGIVMKNATPASTVLTAAPLTDGYRIVRFLPGGGIDLNEGALEQWTVSIASQNAPVVENGLPANFATLSFDPVSGTSALFRP